mgnify:CR=1 FL=1
MGIKDTISRIIYDQNIDPAFFRVIFKRQEGEYWDVPFNFLRFHGSYFSYGEADAIYPLHRIVAIYDHKGKYHIRRNYNPEHVIIKPAGIEIISGLSIKKYMDPFRIARYSWLIIRHVEKVAENNPDDAATMLGDYLTLGEFRLIIEEYFKGTIVYKGRVARGNEPMKYNNLSENLTHQRIYVYPDEKELTILHRLDEKIIEIEEKEIMRPTNRKKLIPRNHSAIIASGKILCLIDQDTKLILHPKRTENICRKNIVGKHS